MIGPTTVNSGSLRTASYGRLLVTDDVVNYPSLPPVHWKVQRNLVEIAGNTETRGVKGFVNGTSIKEVSNEHLKVR